MILKNNKERESFLENYQDWDLLEISNVTGLCIYRYRFDNGDYITALENGYWEPNVGQYEKSVITTLTQQSERYIPLPFTKKDLMYYLRNNVPSKEA